MKFKSLCAFGFALCVISLLVIFSVFNSYESTERQTLQPKPTKVIYRPAMENLKPAPKVSESHPAVPKPTRTAPDATEKINQNSPSVFAPQPSFTFDPVIDGAMITHDFTIQNKGIEPLVLESVKTG